MIFKKLNKRGDLPVMVLVIGVVAICILVLLSFSFSLSKSIESFKRVGVIEELNFQVDKYNFYKEVGESSEVFEKYFKIGNIDLIEVSGVKFIEVKKLDEEKELIVVRYALS